MKRAALAFACLGLTLIPERSPGAGFNGSARATVRIVEGASIDLITPLVLPSVQLPASSTRVAESSPLAGNALLTIHGQVGDVLSMAVPDKLTLVRDGGSESLTFDTSANYGLLGRGVLMGGDLINGNAMSVDIGGKLSLASADQLVPGPYEGLFVVVVQYN